MRKITSFSFMQKNYGLIGVFIAALVMAGVIASCIRISSVSCPTEVLPNSTFTAQVVVNPTTLNQNVTTRGYLGVMLPKEWTIGDDAVTLVINKNGQTSIGFKYNAAYTKILNEQSPAWPDIDGGSYKWWGCEALEDFTYNGMSNAVFYVDIEVDNIERVGELVFYVAQQEIKTGNEVPTSLVEDKETCVVYTDVRVTSDASGIEKEPMDAKSNWSAYSLGNGQLCVNLNSIQDAGNINVYNMQGQLVSKKQVSELTTVIDGDFSRGVYIVKKEANGKSDSKKVVIR